MSWRRLASSSRAGEPARGIGAHRKRLRAIMILPAALIAFALPAGAAAAAQPFAFGPVEEMALAGGIAPTSGSQPYVNLFVSCSAAGECAAAGHYEDATTKLDKAFVATESNGAWSAAKAIELPANAANPSFAYFDAISCAPGGACVAVGAYEDESGEYVPMAASEADGGWSVTQQMELPAGALTSGQEADLADVPAPLPAHAPLSAGTTAPAASTTER